MKKLLKATLLLAALTVYTSCSDDNDLKSPSERLQEATAKYMDVLTSAPNGWAMTMYGDLDFGGFNVLCKFEKNGKVTVQIREERQSNYCQREVCCRYNSCQPLQTGTE